MVLVVKNLPANAGDLRDIGSILGLGRCPGGGRATHSSILALRILMDRGAWWATVPRVTKSWTQLKQLRMKARMTFYCKRHAKFQTENGVEIVILSSVGLIPWRGAYLLGKMKRFKSCVVLQKFWSNSVLCAIHI